MRLRPHIARFILDAATAVTIDTGKQNAIDIVFRATNIGAANRIAWWRWTCWLAAALTIERIEAA